jgi:cell division transport system permease protein
MKKNKNKSGNKIPYLFSEGMRGLYRNKVLSVTSILVLSACIVVVGLFIILTHIIENNLSTADELYVVTAYVSTDCEEEKILASKNKIESFDNVKSVAYISKSDALEELKQEGGDLSDVVNKYENQLSGYIRARFDITFESYDRLNALVSSVENVEGVETVNTKLDLYHGISKMKKAVTAVSSALIIMLFFVAVFVTLNTVRIGIYYRKDEISLMRYMGATKLFITSPYIIECFFMGAVAVLIAFGANFALYDFVISDWIKDYGILEISSFSAFLPQILPAFLCVGLLSSSLSGLICVKKYLNV